MNRLTKIGVDRDADGVFPVYVDEQGELWAPDPDCESGRLCPYIGNVGRGEA